MKTLQLCGLFLALAVLAGGGGISLLVAQDKDKKEYVSPALPGGVPVFQPGKDDKKDDKKDTKEIREVPPVAKGESTPPPKVIESDDGKMPLKFLKNKLSDMDKGDKGYIPASAVMVDSNRLCWVDPDTIYAMTPQKRDTAIQVSRDDKGYHLAIAEKMLQHKWHAEDDAKMKSMAAVKTIKVLSSAE